MWGRDVSGAGRDFVAVLHNLECASKSLGDPLADSESEAWGGMRSCMSNTCPCDVVVCCP